MSSETQPRSYPIHVEAWINGVQGMHDDGTPPQEIHPTHNRSLSISTNVSSTNAVDHSTTSTSPLSSQSTETDGILSDTSSPSIFLDATVIVESVIGHIGTFEVTEHPITSNGRLCLLKCHQDIAMPPELTIVWHLEEVELGNNYVEYTATNREMQVIRNLRVPKMWTVEGQEDQEDET
jgi:hypothetical protein